MKLIALDMDGTLLSSKHVIPEENLKAIYAAQNAGHIVMICSGRAKEHITAFLAESGLDCPVVASSNGAVVSVNNEIISEVSMSRQVVRDVTAKLEKEHAPYKLYTNKGIFTTHNWSEKVKKEFNEAEFKHEKCTPEELIRFTEDIPNAMAMQYVNDVEELLQDEEIVVHKFFVLTLDTKKQAHLRETMAQPEIMVTSSLWNNVEIMDKDGHKGNGIKAVAKHYNIPIEDTIAMGDNYNDVGMLDVAGFSIVMENGEQDLKEKYDAVTLTNDENGVAHAIYKYVLEK
jgi:Cof subfamily protein (haloacid dehalogenase superfamily)